ncbi:hypothetical protein RB195_020425 [Necator americanus]|uniref:Uncharacterized protein n=1 Tax=Necator americanus TaxID=51031 RepID=A0ABR1CK49_NECAM
MKLFIILCTVTIIGTGKISKQDFKNDTLEKTKVSLNNNGTIGQNRFKSLTLTGFDEGTDSSSRESNSVKTTGKNPGGTKPRYPCRQLRLRAAKSWSTGPLLMPRATWQPDIPTRNRVKKLNGADEKNRYIFSCTNNSCNFHIRMNIAIPPTDRENDHSETSLEETVSSTEETMSSKEENQNQEVADDDCEDGDEAVLEPQKHDRVTIVLKKRCIPRRGNTTSEDETGQKMV